jgi:hypothetical protein
MPPRWGGGRTIAPDAVAKSTSISGEATARDVGVSAVGENAAASI